ncbi:MAG: hypothetical protein EHM45_01010 [Desulfobacteraceae bacterium]|nr:MAG: hypothetical protein EHM45_01010 [Desulfobacteraceae bacterium]
MIEQAESVLRELGLTQCRVRHHGPLARIEILENDFEKILLPAVRNRVSEQFRCIGYHYVTLDLGGFISGSLNRVLNPE